MTGDADLKSEESGQATGSATGDRDRLLSRLYRDHYRALCLRLRQLYGSGPPEPEDVAQSAFQKLSEIGDLTRIEHPRAFLFRTAINLGLNAISRQSVARRFAERELAGANMPVVEENTPEDVYYMRQRMKRTQTAFAVLTQKQKEIVVRSRLKGETYAEIQKATGWSQADISRQMKLALQAMLSAMDNEIV